MSNKKSPEQLEVKPALHEQIEKSSVKPAGGKKSYSLDLRIQSPGNLGYLGIEGMDTAPAVLRLAKVKGIDAIAVTDFYRADFLGKVIEASQSYPVRVIPGVALRCRLGVCDDCIFLALFPEGQGQTEIEDFLRIISVPESAKGRESYLLETPILDIIQETEKRGGRLLPSRMDQTPFRKAVIPQLVEEYGFRAFDLAYEDSREYFREHWPKRKFQLFSFSNASALAQVGSRSSRVKLPSLAFDSLLPLVERVHE